jgi:hypothetical protein
MVRFQILADKDFSVVHNIGCGAHPTPYPVGTRGNFPEVKKPGREGDHSSPSSAEVKNGAAVPLLLHMSSWHSA